MRTKIDFNFEMQVEFDNCSIPLSIFVEGYRPERPAPACSNPSDPRFSDSGLDAEFEDYEAYIIVKKGDTSTVIITPAELIQIADCQIVEQIFREGKNRIEKDYYTL